jgi:hypothetical protein
MRIAWLDVFVGAQWKVQSFGEFVKRNGIMRKEIEIKQIFRAGKAQILDKQDD